MAGDLELQPTLQDVCIKAIANRIEHYIAKQSRSTQSKPHHCHTDAGISGSTIKPCTDSNDNSMDCDDSPRLAALEIDSEKFMKETVYNSNQHIFQNIESLQEKCIHNPPCGTRISHTNHSHAQHSIYIPRPVSEQLLKEVCKKGHLSDQVAEWFSDSSRFHIKYAYLKRAGHLTTNGLRALFSKHTFTEINAENINEGRHTKRASDGKRITVNDIIGCMNASTKASLMNLNISYVTSERDEHKTRAVLSFGQFKRLSVLSNVRTLNVSHTNFSDNDLNAVIACMKHLQCLDISKTSVRSIFYLGDIQAPKLTILRMNNLDKLHMPKESLFDVFCKMKELRCLDISIEIRTQPNLGEQNSVTTAISMVMVGGGHALKNLVSLDISGREGIEEIVFLNFFASHPRLTFLGLLQTSLDGLSCFEDKDNEDSATRVKVAGNCSESQIIESLTRYHQRPIFAKEALYALFNHTQHNPLYNKQQLELVLRCMRYHQNPSDEAYSVQLAASACVYNLTNRETGFQIPVPVLSQVVTATLVTMNLFSDRRQLQKNCLMTLCNDRILKNVPFDYFKTARLVMQCLCSSDDGAMHRMAVAIISILAAKISTEETAILGSNTNMKALLQIVDQKLNVGALDLTLKFALSALWNLTDESPSTCRNFIENNGLALVLRVLSIHDDNPCVQTKVLGLLNNLAEVAELRPYLLHNKMALMQNVRTLLASEHIEVCYFAAGVISHLAMLDDAEWDSRLICNGMREACLEDLFSCVMSWKPPEGEMVAYRTFKPFFPLLRRHDTPAIQLWAAWAICHVCLKNGEKYQEMLLKEKGVECLQEICREPRLDENVAKLVRLTLDFIND